MTADAAQSVRGPLVVYALRRAGLLAPVRVEPAGPELTVLVVVVVNAEMVAPPAPDRRDEGSQ